MAVKRKRSDATADAQASKWSGVWQFASKAVATTLVGTILTIAIAIAQISYSNHLEILRRQAEQGGEMQARLLQITGRIENELWAVARSMTEQERTREEAERLRNEVTTRWNRDLAPLFLQWRSDRLMLRNQASQIYGRDVAALIYDRSDSRFYIDGCDVVRRGADPRINDCAGPMRAEWNRLAPFVAALARGETLEAFRAASNSPISFNANAEIAFTILSHYLECTAPADPTVRPKSRCNNLPAMLEIARRRVSLVGVARENLADAIMAASALRD
jgi:hypothetical protein